MNLEELYKDPIYIIGIAIVFTICLCMLLLSTCEPARADTLHFKDKEFACKCCDKIVIDKKLLQKLEELREYIDMPIYITSGYRCPKHNKTVGGVKNSQHLQGKAIDIYCKGLSMQELAKAVEWAEFGFIKVYKGWIHVDVR